MEAAADPTLTGCYLLVIVSEPFSREHKERIIQKVAKGLLSWDIETTGCDLVGVENVCKYAEPEEGSDMLIQHATENLAVEVLLNPELTTVRQCLKNLLSSTTKHKHLIHAGYSFAGSGAWLLQDGTFSFRDFSDAFRDVEVQRILKAYPGCSIHVHCTAEGDWNQVNIDKHSFSRLANVALNPPDKISNLPGSAALTECLESAVIYQPLEDLMKSSSVVGNIRFHRPTLYVFPGGQGDCALFGVSGFNMLIDGGFTRKPCFWEFIRHLDRLDAVLVTRLSESNLNGVTSMFKRKALEKVFPQVGYVFCNIAEVKYSPSDEMQKDRDELIVSVIHQGHEFLDNLYHSQLKPHMCYRASAMEPFTLYNKVGHGTLEMYVISPPRESRELKDFLYQWASFREHFSFVKTGMKFNEHELSVPLCHAMSICALIVWKPADPKDTISRILFPGSAPQSKIFEGLEKLKNLNVLNFPLCTASSLRSASVEKSKFFPEKPFAKMANSKPRSSSPASQFNRRGKEGSPTRKDNFAERKTQSSEIIKTTLKRQDTPPKRIDSNKEAQDKRNEQKELRKAAAAKKETKPTPSKPSEPKKPIEPRSKGVKDVVNKKTVEAKVVTRRTELSKTKSPSTPPRSPVKQIKSKTPTSSPKHEPKKAVKRPKTVSASEEKKAEKQEIKQIEAESVITENNESVVESEINQKGEVKIEEIETEIITVEGKTELQTSEVPQSNRENEMLENNIGEDISNKKSEDIRNNEVQVEIESTAISEEHISPIETGVEPEEKGKLEAEHQKEEDIEKVNEDNSVLEILSSKDHEVVSEKVQEDVSDYDLRHNEELDNVPSVPQAPSLMEELEEVIEKQDKEITEDNLDDEETSKIMSPKEQRELLQSKICDEKDQDETDVTEMVEEAIHVHIEPEGKETTIFGEIEIEKGVEAVKELHTEQDQKTVHDISIPEKHEDVPKSKVLESEIHYEQVKASVTNEIFADDVLEHGVEAVQDDDVKSDVTQITDDNPSPLSKEQVLDEQLLSENDVLEQKEKSPVQVPEKLETKDKFDTKREHEKEEVRKMVEPSASEHQVNENDCGVSKDLSKDESNSLTQVTRSEEITSIKIVTSSTADAKTEENVEEITHISEKAQQADVSSIKTAKENQQLLEKTNEIIQPSDSSLKDDLKIDYKEDKIKTENETKVDDQQQIIETEKQLSESITDASVNVTTSGIQINQDSSDVAKFTNQYQTHELQKSTTENLPGEKQLEKVAVSKERVTMDDSLTQKDTTVVETSQEITIPEGKQMESIAISKESVKTDESLTQKETTVVETFQKVPIPDEKQLGKVAVSEDTVNVETSEKVSNLDEKHVGKVVLSEDISIVETSQVPIPDEKKVEKVAITKESVKMDERLTQEDTTVVETSHQVIIAHKDNIKEISDSQVVSISHIDDKNNISRDEKTTVDKGYIAKEQDFRETQLFHDETNISNVAVEETTGTSVLVEEKITSTSVLSDSDVKSSTTVEKEISYSITSAGKDKEESSITFSSAKEIKEKSDSSIIVGDKQEKAIIELSEKEKSQLPHEDEKEPSTSLSLTEHKTEKTEADKKDGDKIKPKDTTIDVKVDKTEPKTATHELSSKISVTESITVHDVDLKKLKTEPEHILRDTAKSSEKDAKKVSEPKSEIEIHISSDHDDTSKRIMEKEIEFESTTVSLSNGKQLVTDEVSNIQIVSDADLYEEVTEKQSSTTSAIKKVENPPAYSEDHKTVSAKSDLGIQSEDKKSITNEQELRSKVESATDVKEGGKEVEFVRTETDEKTNIAEEKDTLIKDEHHTDYENVVSLDRESSKTFLQEEKSHSRTEQETTKITGQKTEMYQDTQSVTTKDHGLDSSMTEEHVKEDVLKSSKHVDSGTTYATESHHFESAEIQISKNTKQTMNENIYNGKNTSTDTSPQDHHSAFDEMSSVAKSDYEKRDSEKHKTKDDFSNEQKQLISHEHKAIVVEEHKESEVKASIQQHTTEISQASITAIEKDTAATSSKKANELHETHETSRDGVSVFEQQSIKNKVGDASTKELSSLSKDVSKVEVETFEQHYKEEKQVVAEVTLKHSEEHEVKSSVKDSQFEEHEKYERDTFEKDQHSDKHSATLTDSTIHQQEKPSSTTAIFTETRTEISFSSSTQNQIDKEHSEVIKSLHSQVSPLKPTSEPDDGKEFSSDSESMEEQIEIIQRPTISQSMKDDIQSGMKQLDSKHNVSEEDEEVDDDEMVRHPTPPGQDDFYSQIGVAVAKSDSYKVSPRSKTEVRDEPLYEEPEEDPPIEEQPVFGSTLNADYPEFVSISEGTTPSEPQSPPSPSGMKINGESSGFEKNLYTISETQKSEFKTETKGISDGFKSTTTTTVQDLSGHSSEMTKSGCFNENMEILSSSTATSIKTVQKTDDLVLTQSEKPKDNNVSQVAPPLYEFEKKTERKIVSSESLIGDVPTKESAPKSTKHDESIQQIPSQSERNATEGESSCTFPVFNNNNAFPDIDSSSVNGRSSDTKVSSMELERRGFRQGESIMTESMYGDLQFQQDMRPDRVEYPYPFDQKNGAKEDSNKQHEKESSDTEDDDHAFAMTGSMEMTTSFIGSSLSEIPSSSLSQDTSTTGHQSASKKPSSFHLEDWGKPMGLPSPPDPVEIQSPNSSKSTLKSKSSATPVKSVSNKMEEEKNSRGSLDNGKPGNTPNKIGTTKPDKGTPTSKGKSGDNHTPVYVDLTYVPHHGDPHYCDINFFKRIRARYYVFSGTSPSKEVFNALLEAKKCWEDKTMEVTVIPTYETDTLGYWMALNQDALTEMKIDVAPSASRCTISLQDHETSCAAYRLEF